MVDVGMAGSSSARVVVLDSEALLAWHRLNPCVGAGWAYHSPSDPGGSVTYEDGVVLPILSNGRATNIRAQGEVDRWSDFVFERLYRFSASHVWHIPVGETASMDTCVCYESATFTCLAGSVAITFTPFDDDATRVEVVHELHTHDSFTTGDARRLKHSDRITYTNLHSDAPCTLRVDVQLVNILKWSRRHDAAVTAIAFGWVPSLRRQWLLACVCSSSREIQ